MRCVVLVKMESKYSDLQATGTNLQIWTSLNTVTKFDEGSTAIVGMAENGVALRDANHFSPISLLIESLVEELCKLLVKNSKQQKKLYNVICRKLHQMNLIDQTYDVEEFEFMRTHYQKALFQLLTVAKSVATVGANDGALLRFPSFKMGTSEYLLSSRYRTEFEELEYIARGGFGKVYRSRNKLDGMHYAIKKICLQYHNIAGFLNNLHEVKMLARLNHPNIVTYKAAWLEPLAQAPEPSMKVETKTSEEESGSIVFESSHQEETVYEREEASCTCNVPSQNSQDRSENSITTIEDSDSSPENMVCTYQSTSNKVMSVKNFIVYESALLYVQMQLCERTLRQWLDDRNKCVPCNLDIKESIRIFEQIVQGVCYIHSQHIVHHDIKPSNIFINSDLTQVQVGDFGLACCLQHSTDEVTLLSECSQHGEIGTKLYAAPEQLRGRCNPKSDVYSLGVVLFELLQPFSTDMERCKVIAQLKQGNIPTELTVVAPKWSQLISRLMKTSAALRPTADELREMLTPLVKEITEDTENVDNMKETIQQLLAVISEKDKQIEDLQKKVKDMENSKSVQL